MTPPARTVGLYSATSLVIASMVGAGVFTTSGYALADLGQRGYVLAAWIVGGAVALCGAASYGALSRAVCESGGEYVFLARAVHPLAGFLAGWVSLLAGFTGALAFAAAALEEYLRPVIAESLDLPPDSIAASAVLLCVGLHAYHIRTGTRFQNGLVTVKLVSLITFAGVALWLLCAQWPLVGEATTSKSGSLWTLAFAFANTVTWVSLSYSGFNAAVYIADEVRDPKRTVPRSLLLGSALVTILYLLMNAIALWSGPREKLAGEGDVLAVAAGLLGGNSLALVCRAIVVGALATSISAMVMSGPRVYAKMAADGLFPLPLGTDRRMMSDAVILQGLLAILLVYFSHLIDLLNYLGFMLSISAAATVATLFLLAGRNQEFVPPPGYPLTPIVFVGATLIFGTMTALRNPWACTAAAAATLVSGVLIFYLHQGLRAGAEFKR